MARCGYKPPWNIDEEVERLLKNLKIEPGPEDVMLRYATFVALQRAHGDGWTAGKRDTEQVHQRKDRSLLATIAGTVFAGYLRVEAFGELRLEEQVHDAVNIATAILAEVDRRAKEGE